jgi:hypothetical protein
VAPLAADAVRAGKHAAIDHDAAARAGAEDCAEHDAAAARRAVGGLGKREAVGIVLESEFALEQSLEVGLERLAVVRGCIRILDQASRRRHGARQADSHRCTLAEFRFCVPDQCREMREGLLVAAVRRRRTAPQTLAAALIEDRQLGLGAADVHANAQHRAPQ